MDGDLGGCENAKKGQAFSDCPINDSSIKRLRILRAESYGSIPQFLVIGICNFL